MTNRRLRPEGCPLLALCAAGIAGAALATANVRLLDAPAPHDPLAATPTTALGLLAHNALVALWPLALVAIGWPALRGARMVGDMLVAGQLLAHGLIVGNALGQQPATWRYLPHLPLEWLALAATAGAWRDARRHDPSNPGIRAAGPDLARLAAEVLAALAIAALVETYLVPLP